MRRVTDGQTERPVVTRSSLFVPAHVTRFVETAWRRGADVIILDLEDSVAASAKAAARQPYAPQSPSSCGAAPRSPCVSTTTAGARTLTPHYDGGETRLAAPA